ncbi:RING finger protein 122 isoform X2 [Silurus meridionalis]|uniref:RING finger protein 122 isoform X2 n=1 Tax=Silurus meridionalis TaxID=175797 RepID=UPI001EEBB089|nr:RING finger protein 122 isoform X2 [Silurus meridionalis]
MQPFQWCNGCFCSLGVIFANKSCTMPPVTFQDLPLNIYMVIFGTGIFVFVLSLIFCCYFISKLRQQAQSERFGYKEVILKGDMKKLNLHGTCAVCLEDFRLKDELGVLPCQHAFHRRKLRSEHRAAMFLQHRGLRTLLRVPRVADWQYLDPGPTDQ